jgi:hypothetical protein
MSISLRRPGAALAAAAICSIGMLPVAGAQSPQPAPYPSAPSPYTPTTPPPLETGGLRPPSSPPPTPAQSETIQQLERAEKEDAGRGLSFFWVDVEGGYEYVALQAFHADSLLDDRLLADDGSGLMLGVGAGVRLIFVTLGARFRLGHFSDWDLWTLGGEVGLHLPVGSLETSFTAGAGYAALARPSVDDAPPGFDADAIDVSGLDTRLGANLDYYVNPLLSFGVRGSFEALFLWRAAASGPSVPGAELYADDGQGIGRGVTLGATAGLHF